VTVSGRCSVCLRGFLTPASRPRSDPTHRFGTSLSFLAHVFGWALPVISRSAGGGESRGVFADGQELGMAPGTGPGARGALGRWWEGSPNKSDLGRATSPDPMLNGGAVAPKLAMVSECSRGRESQQNPSPVVKLHPKLFNEMGNPSRFGRTDWPQRKKQKRISRTGEVRRTEYRIPIHGMWYAPSCVYGAVTYCTDYERPHQSTDERQIFGTGKGIAIATGHRAKIRYHTGSRSTTEVSYRTSHSCTVQYIPSCTPYGTVTVL
jgi:hypothetical protein